MKETKLKINPWVTVGRINHQGMNIPARVITGEEADLWPDALADETRYKLVLLQSQNALVTAAGESVSVVAPAAVFLTHDSTLRLSLDRPLPSDKLILFHPRYIFDSLTLDYRFDDDAHPDTAIDHYLLVWFSEEKTPARRVLFLEAALSRYLDDTTVKIMEELEAQPDGYWPCRARSFLLQLLIACTHLAEKQAGDNIPDLVPRAVAPIAPVLTFITAHLGEKLTVDRIAREFNTNRTSLQEKLRLATGLSVAQYLIRLRVQTAAILLRNTSLALPEVMQRTGFIDEGHFCRCFKKYAGRTPAEFRKAFIIPKYVMQPVY